MEGEREKERERENTYCISGKVKLQPYCLHLVLKDDDDIVYLFS